MLKIIKNKKAFTIEPLIIIICFVVFAFIGLIFYILFGLAGKLSVYDLNLGSDLSGSSNLKLQNYLRMPVTLSINKVQMGDLLARYYTETDKTKKEEYSKIIDAATLPLLNSME